MVLSLGSSLDQQFGHNWHAMPGTTLHDVGDRPCPFGTDQMSELCYGIYA